jgi:hypothetical protein
MPAARVQSKDHCNAFRCSGHGRSSTGATDSGAGQPAATARRRRAQSRQTVGRPYLDVRRGALVDPVRTTSKVPAGSVGRRSRCAQRIPPCGVIGAPTRRRTARDGPYAIGWGPHGRSRRVRREGISLYRRAAQGGSYAAAGGEASSRPRTSACCWATSIIREGQRGSACSRSALGERLVARHRATRRRGAETADEVVAICANTSPSYKKPRQRFASSFGNCRARGHRMQVLRRCCRELVLQRLAGA